MRKRRSSRVGRLLFLPRFHPELNPIERYWGHCKKKTRDPERIRSFDDLKKKMGELLQMCPTRNYQEICKGM